MVGVEDLACLDYTLWLRSGRAAARLNGCNQSTVSRRINHCLGVFGVAMERRQREWQLSRSHLLQLQREVHQQARLLGREPLRLEACPLTATVLALPLPEGWIGGCFDHIGVPRPLQLLHERVIDAWICDALEDLPQPLAAGLQAKPLWRFPAELLVAPSHPLALERGLRYGDLRFFPCLDIPPQAYPCSHHKLRGRGVNALNVRIPVYESAIWEGRSADALTLVPFTPLNHLCAPELVRLDIEPPCWNGGGLLCRAELAEAPPIKALEQELRRRLSTLESRVPQLQRL